MNESKQRATQKARCPVFYLERMKTKSNNKKHMALFVIMNYSKQRAKQKTHMALFVILKTNANKEQNKKHMWHCLLS